MSRIHCEWGEQGLRDSTEANDVVVIVDVLSFSTAVEVATARGAEIHPLEEKQSRAAALAQELGAELAQPRGRGKFSLSPAGYLDVSPGTRIVLPSLNGARLTTLARAGTVLAGCLRNASAVARTAARSRKRIAVIPAGERWPDGSLRPALEDWLGAGAIASALEGSHSPEAEATGALFQALRPRLRKVMLGCASGVELVQEGFEQDVLLAAEHDVSDCVPELIEGAYVRSST